MKFLMIFAMLLSSTVFAKDMTFSQVTAVNLASAGTAQPLSATSAYCACASVTALAANSGTIYVGDVNVSSANGLPLAAGKTTVICARGIQIYVNLKSIYIDGSNTGDDVQVSCSNNGDFTVSSASGGGSGTATSVGLVLPNIFSVSGSPVTTAGTLTATLANETANLIFAGPSTGSPATPTFRAMVAADLPTVTVAKGGTGNTSGTSGGIPYYSSSSTIASSGALAQYGVVLGGGAGATPVTLAPDASTSKVLVSGGASANPAWGTVSVAGGGTGATTLTNHGVLLGQGTSAVAALSAAGAGTILGGVASSDPAFTAVPSLGVAATTAGTIGLANGSASGKVVTIKNSSATAADYNFNLPATAGSSGDVLLSGGGGSSAMTWSTPSSSAANSSLVITNGSGYHSAKTIQVVETVVAGGTCSTSYNVDPTAGTMINLTLSGACAIGVTNLAAGHSFIIKLTQSSTTLPTFTSAYKWATATTPTFSSSATKYDYIACASLDGTTLGCNATIDVR